MKHYSERPTIGEIIETILGLLIPVVLMLMASLFVAHVWGLR